MDYADYRQSRDMTWRLLLKHDVTALPVRVGAICRAEGLTVISYHDADPLIRQYGLTEHAAANDGFTLGKIIFYDDARCTPERQRVTIAHELGHIMLHHSGKLKNREPADGDATVEQAANVFASRLLAPACVLWGCRGGIRDGVRRNDAKPCDTCVYGTFSDYRNRHKSGFDHINDHRQKNL